MTDQKPTPDTDPVQVQNDTPKGRLEGVAPGDVLAMWSHYSFVRPPRLLETRRIVARTTRTLVITKCEQRYDKITGRPYGHRTSQYFAAPEGWKPEEKEEVES